MRSRASALLLVASLVLGACQTTHLGTPIPAEPVPPDVESLYRLYGPPDAIRREGEDRYLRYDYRLTKGATFGARYLALALIIGRRHAVQDRFWVTVGPDDRVREMEPMVATDELGYRLWPFGD